MLYKLILCWGVALSVVSSHESPLHMISQGKFVRVSSASHRSRRTAPILGLEASDKDVESPWLSVSAAVGVKDAKSLGAKMTIGGGIQLVPIAVGLEDVSGTDEYLAHGTYHDRLERVGWSSLMMHTSTDQGTDDGIKMYAAGAIEGFLTAKRIDEFHYNDRVRDVRLPKLLQSLRRTVVGLMEIAEDGHKFAASSSKSQARLALLQTWGVRDGYSLAAEDGMATLSMPEMFLLNSDGVVDELLTAMGGSRQSSLRGAVSSVSTVLKNPSKSDRCTSVVRLANDNSELYFGHTTWEPFSEMTRIWKVYDFPLRGVAARKISFSSYPGCISSTDDFYLMDSGLAIMETTLEVLRKEKYPSAQTIPDFVRIMTANRLSSNATDWVQSMVDSATGTYSSQWMVMDYRKFTPGQELPDGAFYVFEQAPDTFRREDMSSHLRKNHYWASFNRAFFDDVRSSIGESRENSPRDQIVRNTEDDITSLAAMRKEMTRNKGTKEPVDEPGLRSPSHAISARKDLVDNEGRINRNGNPYGGVDAKITSSCLFRTLAAQAISSPSHSSLPAFRWTSSNGSEIWPGYSHKGLPRKANFDWVQVLPQEEMLNPLDGSCK